MSEFKKLKLLGTRSYRDEHDQPTRAVEDREDADRNRYMRDLLREKWRRVPEPGDAGIDWQPFDPE